MNTETTKKNRRKIQGAYSITIISITMVLLIFGFTVLLLVNGSRLTNYIKENIGFTVYISDDAKSADVKRLEKMMNAEDYSRSVKYISKQDAATIMREELGDDFEALLGENIFPASIEVYLNPKYASPDSMETIRNSLSEHSFITEIFYQKSLAELVSRNVRKMSIAGFIFTVLFLIISFSLINNTIRLSVYSKRFLIRTAKLLGAEDAYVRRPFVINSIASGLLGGALASLIIYFSVLFLKESFSEVLHIDGELLSMIIVIIFGVVITAFSAYVSANKYIRSNSQDIYFEN